MNQIILASTSPRRRNLLKRLLTTFQVRTSNVEEAGSDLFPETTLPLLPLPQGFDVPPESDPQLWAWRKAMDVATSHPALAEGDLMLGADTIVISRERVLGKPRNLDEAREMLLLLRSTEHYVLTGYALLQNLNGRPVTLHTGEEATRVVMRAFSDAELQGFVVSGEPLDKAGAYALQGEGGKLVAAVEGCATNVIGLPVCRARSLLKDAGTPLLPYPAEGYCAACHGQPRVNL
ncbi:MAG: Maf family protein [Chloroflexia bacterium]